jgi:hypothetical protein
LDENGGPNPGQHRSIRPAYVRRPTFLTYVTNHWDRRLAQVEELLATWKVHIASLEAPWKSDCPILRKIWVQQLGQFSQLAAPGKTADELGPALAPQSGIIAMRVSCLQAS